jgi:uncharacterized protein DUF6916
MLEQFTLDTFTPQISTPFRVHVPGADPFRFTLEAVTEIPVSGWRPDDTAEHRNPFTLLFLGPPGFILQQAIYQFEHETIGTFDLFIVPVGQSAQGISYEAVFS